MRLPFLAVGAALPSPPPPPDTGPVVGLSEQGQESVASPLAPGIFALSTQDQQSFATPLNPVVLGVSEQDSVSTGVYSVTGLSEQDQISFGRPLATAIFALSDQDQESTATPEAGSTTYANGYAAQFEIRLRPTAPGAVTVDNFLLPFAETIPQFRTVANGGLSQNNGLDIRFETPAGVKIGHVRADYNATTGRFAALVNIPNRNFATEQSIFVYVGKASASEADAATARAGGWLAWYFGNSTTDQTGQSRTLTNNGVGSFPLGAWPAGGFDGVADHFIGNAAATWANGLAGITYVSFHKADRTDQKSEVFNVAGANAELSLHFNDTTDNRLTAVARYGASTLQYQSANQRQTTEPQAVGVAWEAGQPTRMVIDGVLDVPASPSGVPAGTTTVTDTLEWGRGARGDLIYWDGTLSFLGFCNRALRTAELEQMTAAFIDPRLVYGISSANIATAANRAPVALRVDATGTNGVSSVINVAGTGFDPNGDALSVSSAIVVSGTATVTLSGTSSIEVTPSGTAAQSVVIEFTLSDGKGGTSVGRCYIASNANDLFNNPFNRLSAHHLPIGSGVRLGIPPSVASNRTGSTTASDYSGGVPLNDEGTNAAAARGRLGSLPIRMDLEDSIVGTKYYYRCTTGDLDLGVTIDLYVNDVFSETVTVDLPKAGNNAFYPVVPDGSDRDYQASWYPRSGTDDFYQTIRGFDRARERGLGVLKQWPLKGLDAPEPSSPGDDGTSASRLRWPSGFLRGFEINSATDTTPIGHALNASVARQFTPATATRPASGAPPETQILSRRCVWPAYGVDGSANSDPNDNNGDIPYGTLLTITTEDYNSLLLTTECSTVRGRKILDCVYFYGIYVVDGNGSANSVQIRVDSFVGYQADPTVTTGARPGSRQIAGVRDQINAALRVMQDKLWPVFNSKTYSTTDRQLVSGLPYVGGGGPRDGKPLSTTGSKNTAYDVPST